MTDAVNIDRLAGEIRRIYRSDPKGAEAGIAKFLKDELEHTSPESKANILNRLSKTFMPANTASSEIQRDGGDTLHKIFSLIIGKDLAHDEELTTADFLEKLADPLNNIFDTLNELIRVMNVTLTGSESGDHTIRTLIGNYVAGEAPSDSLEQYLAQIKNAFLTAHQAFRSAAGEKVGMILKELNPDRISAETGKGLKIGPMKKAEAFEIYRQKYERIQRWFNSDRFSEDLIREFEKECRKRIEKG